MKTHLVKPKSYVGRRNDVATFLNWVQAGDVALVPPGTFDPSILRIPKLKFAPRGIITAASLTKLLEEARRRSLYDELCVSLQAHRGVRTEEIDRIYFYMFRVNENRIVLPEACEVTGFPVSKGGFFRQMKMQPAFRRRLKELIDIHKPNRDDLINPDGIRHDGEWVIKVPEIARSVGVNWKLNCLRHSFGSHHRAYTRNIYLVAEET